MGSSNMGSSSMGSSMGSSSMGHRDDLRFQLPSFMRTKERRFVRMAWVGLDPRQRLVVFAPAGLIV